MEVAWITDQEHNQSTPIWEEVPCNLCGARDARIKYAGTKDRDMATLLVSYKASGNLFFKETLVECNRCSLVFTSPRLRKDLILKSYAESEDPAYVSQASGRMKSFEWSLTAIERIKKGSRVLDIGAASGFFLKVAKDRGWKTYGIEPSRYLSDLGNERYGVNIRCGDIETVTLSEKVDVVTLWDVLEHTLDPKEVLTRCNRFLKDGGLVVINYPNIGSWMARLAGRHFWFIISAHLYYFTPKTIAAMLAASGFEVISSRPHFQWLSLGYLICRAEIYSPRIAKAIGRLVDKLGLSSIVIPYFAAQTRVIARKVKPV